MEKDLKKSSPDKSPSDESHNNDQPRTLADGIDDVASGVNVETEEKVVAAENIVLGSQEVGSGKKRGRGDDQGGTSGSSVQKGKKKGELTDPPSSEPKCATCGKAFGSWKAVFGHLRSHPDRDYRGAFPPPKIWEQMLQERNRIHQQTLDIDTKNQQELIASTLLNVARDVSSKLIVGERRGLGIDLNDPKEPETKTEIEIENSDLRKGVFPFDLNMPPPGSDEDDDNSKDES